MRKDLIGGIIVIVLLLSFGTGVVFLMLKSNKETITQTEINIKEKLEANCELIYPFYASLNEEERGYYVKLCAGFEEHLDSVEVVRSKQKSDIDKAVSWVNDNYRNVAYEQPDYFWVNPNSFTLKEISQNKKYALSIDIKYTLTKEEAQEKLPEYDSVVKAIVDEAVAKEYLFDAVLYVYDSILEKTDYDHDLAESTDNDLLGYSSYGCLVEGKTVCSGYTLAFTSIMQKLGITCGAEFDANAEDENAESSHVWNYCKLGEDYYYFDLTWDDTSFDSSELKALQVDHTHDFFAITSRELSYTHENLKTDTISPPCNAEKYNYYIQKSIYCEKYSLDSFKKAVKNQPQDDYVVVKFGSATERAKAEKDLFKREKLYDVFPDVKRVNYIKGASGLQLYIFFVN
ncbi:MAG: hypothetical protein IK955_09005 [Clostridia bacterium]|nr:hypothetical protein [Clostridia bacterium]